MSLRQDLPKIELPTIPANVTITNIVWGGEVYERTPEGAARCLEAILRSQGHSRKEARAVIRALKEQGRAEREAAAQADEFATGIRGLIDAMRD